MYPSTISQLTMYFLIRNNERGIRDMLLHESRNTNDLQLQDEGYDYINIWGRNDLSYATCIVEGDHRDLTFASDGEKRDYLGKNTQAFVLYVHVPSDPLGKHSDPIYIHYINTFPRYRRQSHAIKLLTFLSEKFGPNLSAAVKNLESAALFKKAKFYPTPVIQETIGRTFLWRFDDKSSRNERRRWFKLWQKYHKRHLTSDAHNTWLPSPPI